MRPEKPSKSELNVFDKYIVSGKFMEVITLLATRAKRKTKAGNCEETMH